jgi:hypothetical protein
LGAREKLAVTERARSIVVVQLDPSSAQSPVNPAKSVPSAG